MSLLFQTLGFAMLMLIHCYVNTTRLIYYYVTANWVDFSCLFCYDFVNILLVFCMVFAGSSVG